MQVPVQLSNQLAQGSHPAPPPWHSVQGSFSLVTQEMPSCCKTPKVSPGVGGRTRWKRSSALCPETAVEALSPLGAIKALPALKCPGSEKPMVRPLLAITAQQKNRPSGSVVLELSLLATMGIPAMLKTLVALLRDRRCSGQPKPVLYTGKGLSDRA